MISIADIWQKFKTIIQDSSSVDAIALLTSIPSETSILSKYIIYVIQTCI